MEVAEQAVFDLADGHLDQGHGVALARAAVARRIQHAGDLAGGPKIGAALQVSPSCILKKCSGPWTVTGAFMADASPSALVPCCNSPTGRRRG